MIRKEALSDLSTVRIVNVILFMVWIHYIYGTVRFFIRLPLNYSELLSKWSPGLFFIFIEQIFQIVAFLWIFIYVSKIIRSITKGEPFHPSNPRRIRRVAFGFFFFALTMFLSQFILEILIWKLPHALNLLGSLLWRAFMGAVILMIAEAFEKGIRLQQDQDLTI